MPRAESDLPPVYAASYDHAGIILWGLDRLKQVLETELSWLAAYPDFCLGWDHEAYTYDYLAEQAPEVLETMQRALVRYPGRLGVGSSSYGQPLATFINEESNIRQLTLAMQTAERHLNYPLSVYLMSEHPFHPQLPQMLVGAGFTAAVLRTHFMMYGHNPEYDASVGFWVGVDGSRIPALPTYTGQLVDPIIFHVLPGLTSTLDNRILTDSPAEYSPGSLADFRRQFGERIQPLIATRADDTRNKAALISQHAGDPNYIWVLLEDIFKLLPQPRAEFRPGANDFKVRMPWGYCGNWMWNRTRAVECAVLTAERLAAIHAALHQADCQTQLERAWKNLLAAQHHDIQICGLEQAARTFLDASLESAVAVTEAALAAIAPRIGGPGQRRVLFNPLPWERQEWVPDDQGGAVHTAAGLGFRAVPLPAVTRAQLPVAFQWTSESQSDRLRFPDNIETSATRWNYEPASILGTPHYEVCFSPTGGIRLLTERATGRVILAPPKTSARLVGVINGVEHESRGAISDVSLAPDCAIVIETGAVGGIPYRSEWRFYRHSRRIDWRGELDFNDEWIGRLKVPLTAPDSQPAAQGHALDSQVVPAFDEHEYKLRLRFYPRLGAAAIGIRDLPAHVAETEAPYVQGLYWTALADGQGGLALFNRGQMGSVRESDGAFSSVLAFSLPYIWGTRKLRGRYTYELGLLPFSGAWQAANLQRQALEYNFPFVAMAVTETHDSLGEVWSPYQETSEGAVILSALYAKAGQLYARYYECAGETAEIHLQWLGQPAGLVATNLRETEQAGLGRRLRLGPWQIQTVRLA